jgi:hypothetical protein
MGKEILMNLRKKVSPAEFFRKSTFEKNNSETKIVKTEIRDFNEADKEKLKEVFKKNKGTEKAIILNEEMNEIRSISSRVLISSMRRLNEKPFAIAIDGTVTNPILEVAQELGVKAIAANNFAATSSSIKLLSF